MTTQTGSDVQPAAPPTTPFSSESRNWASISHLSAFVMFFGIPAFVGPLAVWLTKKEDAYVEFHAKEALNFNISFMIYGVVAAISIIFLIGLLVLPAVLITWFVLAINAAIKASSGEYYRYPFTMRFVS
jgi:uncharacterized Tic20 family protein